MKWVLATAVIIALFAGSARADALLDSYMAYIGEVDLFNSNGEPLSEPWQVLRQDRANFHKFGVRQPGDENDQFFASARDRANMERMVRSGIIEPSAARAIMRGHASVLVDIYGRGDMGTRIEVRVTND